MARVRRECARTFSYRPSIVTNNCQRGNLVCNTLYGSRLLGCRLFRSRLFRPRNWVPALFYATIWAATPLSQIYRLAGLVIFHSQRPFLGLGLLLQLEVSVANGPVPKRSLEHLLECSKRASVFGGKGDVRRTAHETSSSQRRGTRYVASKRASSTSSTSTLWHNSLGYC